jgi:uncharacterized membrane protein YfcA
MSQVLINLTRGSKTQQSVFFGEDYCKCYWYDFLASAFYIMICVIVTVFAIKRVNYEQYFKIKYNKGITKSDLKFSPSVVRRLVSVAFIGGWVSGALGLGGGSIFNPVLLSMGIPPAVASSTGMYLVLFTSIGSSITYTIQQTMNVEYALWTGGWCVLGSIAGMKLLKIFLKKWNRQSPIVFLLAGILGISALLIPIFGAIDLVKKIAKKEDVIGLKICDLCLLKGQPKGLCIQEWCS